MLDFSTIGGMMKSIVIPFWKVVDGMMKKALLLTLLLSLIAPVGLCADAFDFYQDVYVSLEGDDTAITLYRTQAHPTGELILTDENSVEIARMNAGENRQQGIFNLPVTQDTPRLQTLSLYLEKDGKMELQDQCILVVDQKGNLPISQVAREEKLLALTFNSANGKGALDTILDVLDQYVAKCTFFLQGPFAENYPDAVMDILGRGHEIGSHGNSSMDYREADNRRIYQDILLSAKQISAVTGQDVTLLRPPYGFNGYRDRAISRALGQEVILWTLDSQDGFKDQTEKNILDRLERCQQNGAIIQMHVYGKYTASVLAKYIPMMQEKGFTFVTVTELLHENGVVDETGTQHAFDPH